MKKLLNRLKTTEHKPRSTQVVPLVEMAKYPADTKQTQGLCPHCKDSMWAVVGGSGVCRQCGASSKQTDLLHPEVPKVQEMAGEGGYHDLGYHRVDNPEAPPEEEGDPLSQDPITTKTSRNKEDEKGAGEPLGMSEDSTSLDESVAKTVLKDALRKAFGGKTGEPPARAIARMFQKFGADPSLVSKGMSVIEGRIRANSMGDARNPLIKAANDIIQQVGDAVSAEYDRANPVPSDQTPDPSRPFHKASLHKKALKQAADYFKSLEREVEGHLSKMMESEDFLTTLSEASPEDLQELRKGQKPDPRKSRGLGLSFWSDENVEEFARIRAEDLLYKVHREQDDQGNWYTNLVYARSVKDKDLDRFLDKLFKVMFKKFSDERRKSFENDPSAVYGGKTNRDAEMEQSRWSYSDEKKQFVRESKGLDLDHWGTVFKRAMGDKSLPPPVRKHISQAQKALDMIGKLGDEQGMRESTLAERSRAAVDPARGAALEKAIGKKLTSRVPAAVTVSGQAGEEATVMVNVALLGLITAAREEVEKSLPGYDVEDSVFDFDERSDTFEMEFEAWNADLQESSEEVETPELTEEMLADAAKLDERTLEVEYLGMVREPGGKLGVALTINGQEYHYAPTAGNIGAAKARSRDGGVKQLAKRFKKVLALSPGRALAWLRKNAFAYAGTKSNPLGSHNKGHFLPDPGKRLKKSKEY